MRRIKLDDEAVRARYDAGESELSIARTLGVSRNVVRQSLEGSGAQIRGIAAALALHRARMTPADRKRQTAAARQAYAAKADKRRGRSPVGPRFWAKVAMSDGCWVWTGSRAKGRWQGYGRINVDGTVQLAHRISWEIHNGPVPDALLVLHHCDNPPCVRPDHLFLGTGADNNADMARKLRSTHGERNTSARLSANDVRAMRLAFEHGVLITELARRFGVSYQSVVRVVHRLTWKHV